MEDQITNCLIQGMGAQDLLFRTKDGPLMEEAGTGLAIDCDGNYPSGGLAYLIAMSPKISYARSDNGSVPTEASISPIGVASKLLIPFSKIVLQYSLIEEEEEDLYEREAPNNSAFLHQTRTGQTSLNDAFID